MDLAFTPEEQKFAAEVRAFVKANLPADVRDKVKNVIHKSEGGGAQTPEKKIN